MKKSHIKAIKDYEDACTQVTEVFIEKYYKRDEPYTFWVGDEIGGVFFINDDCFNIDRMLDALKYNASEDKLFEYQDYELEHALSENGDKPTPINFKNFVKYGKEIIEELGK